MPPVLLTAVRSELDSGLDTWWLLKKMVFLSAGKERPQLEWTRSHNIGQGDYIRTIQDRKRDETKRTTWKRKSTRQERKEMERKGKGKKEQQHREGKERIGREGQEGLVQTDQRDRRGSS